MPLPCHELKIPVYLASTTAKILGILMCPFLRSLHHWKEKFQTKELTFDHLIPRSKGGVTNWENVVTSCSHCNWTKGSKSLRASGFNLLKKPQEPSQYSLRLKSKNFPSNYLHESWRDYLYWDSILEKN